MFGLEKSRELKDVSGRDKEYGARIETDCQRVSKIVGNAKTLTLSLSNGVISLLIRVVSVKIRGVPSLWAATSLTSTK